MIKVYQNFLILSNKNAINNNNVIFTFKKMLFMPRMHH